MMSSAKTFLAASALSVAAVPLGGCASNYAAEGAGAGAAVGAAVGAITGGNIIEGAAIGAAAGGAAGYFIDKDDRCDGYNDDGRLDDDCYGTRGYPDDPR